MAVAEHAAREGDGELEQAEALPHSRLAAALLPATAPFTAAFTAEQDETLAEQVGRVHRLEVRLTQQRAARLERLLRVRGKLGLGLS